MSVRQSAQSVLMVSPASFGFDSQTAVSNKFQVKLPIGSSAITSRAMQEFRTAVATLRHAGINVVVHAGDPTDNKPNAVFPNNWISTWPDGRVFTYPMATTSRRVERDSRVIDQLADKFAIKSVTDLSGSETDERYLESTGVIIFDHVYKIAYGCLSQRCDEELFKSHVESLGYQPIAFHAYDQHGSPIYHTNVMMGVQSTTAVICSEAITDPAERKLVLETLRQNHQVVEISFQQMNSFCGNVLELENRFGDKFLALSQSAYDGFTDEQRQVLACDKKLLPISIPTIETIGGGSVRCMLAEVFLQPVMRSHKPHTRTRHKKAAVSAS